MDVTRQEPLEARLKRMKMRAWRRGIKEMDIVLGPFADQKLGGMDLAALDLFDRLLEENDQDLMAWLVGMAERPAFLAELLAEIETFAKGRLAAG